MTKGDRVQLHPATDWWMRGAKYGTIERIGSIFAWVRLDRTDKVVRLSISLVKPLD